MHRLALLVALAALPSLGGLPDFYKHVDRIVWVVDDIDRTVAGWQKLGMIEVRANEDADEINWSVARLGNVTVDLIQPVDDGTPYAEFKKNHGQGVFALLHRVPTVEAFDQEVARLKALGVETLLSGDIEDAGARFVMFDTEREGKYNIGLVYAPAGPYRGMLEVPNVKPAAKRVSQYAFVAKNLPAVSAYWEKLGFPAMSYTHPALWDLRYHDQAGQFDANLGWQRHGDIVYEWIQPTKGPTTYLDHMSKYGEGVHHIAFDTADIEREKAAWTKAGFPTSQSGAWGERNKPGYGRFAYQDTHAIAGTEVELLWNYRE